MDTPETVAESQLEVIEPAAEENDFRERVEKLLARIEEDPKTRDIMLVEMYLAFTDFELMMRTMQHNGGPIAMLKMMMGKG